MNNKSMMNNKGMTLIEILIVITLIAFIGTIAATKVMKNYDKARKDGTIAMMNEIGLVLDDYKRECKKYPTTEQGLQALVQKPTTGPECPNYDPDGYLKKKAVPKDGFGCDMQYVSDGNKYTLKSLGNDCIEGGEGFDADFTNDAN